MEEIIARRYRLLDQIGSGGEARVFRAQDTEGGEDVAVRLPLLGKAEVIAVPPVVWHQGWVKILDAGTDARRGKYQVFELLHGETLHQKIQRGPLDDEAWLGFIEQSLAAVAALHAAGWVHGDLNADNFLRIETSSCWKLLELPFLRWASRENQSAAFGSIRTLAPEQLQSRAADRRSDLYALGCLYYYAAGGEYPHPGATYQEVAISLLRFPPVPLREKAPGRPPGMADWVMGLLEREPERRYPTATEARRLLEESRR